MVKNVIFVTFLAACISFVQVPVLSVQASETGNVKMEAAAETVADKEAAEKIAQILSGEAEAVTKYAITETNIYKSPVPTSEVLDRTKKNTSVEVALETGGWSMITTSDGCAFIPSEYLASEEVPEYTYSEEDLYVLAHVLAGECQNCPDEEQLYVGSVVLNRVAHPSFPNTIKRVVFQNGQYACTWDGNYYREPTERNWANARKLLESGSVLPADVVWQSGKKQGRGVYIRTRYHYYCY